MIYVDEAGTSEHESCRVVVALMVRDDAQWRAASDMLQSSVVAHVPAPLRQGFAFHAKEVFSGGRTISRSDWPLQSRLEFFREVVSIPRRAGLAVVLGGVKAGSLGNAVPELPRSLVDHFMAFSFTLVGVERHMKNEGSNDLAFIVCEQVPERAKFIKRSLELLQNVPRVLGPEALVYQLNPDPENLVVSATHIKDTVHFASRKDAPLLQIADACAFTMRRSWEQQQHAEGLFQAFSGDGSSRLPDSWNVHPLGSVSWDFSRTVAGDRL